MQCFYHNDADGHCAARWVALSAAVDDSYENSRFEEMDYSKPFPINQIRKDEQVYIVDFSISPDEMRELLKITKNVTWIDHHVTAIDKYAGFGYDIRGVRLVGVAACMLTYCYLHHMTERGHGSIIPFHPFMTERAPLYTKLIADWDVWKFDYGEDTRCFIAAFNSEETGPFSNFWDRFYLKDNAEADLIAKGAIMLEYRDGFMRDYTKLGFEVKFCGLHCFAMNIGHANSEFFKAVDDGSYDALIAFVFNGEKWTVSMYSKNIDVSNIAKLYGGGGHKNAAGFTCMSLPFFKD